MKQGSLLPPETMRDWVAHIDGGSRGNPGPAGYGVVIKDRAGKTREMLSRFIGRATNNVAEYEALLAALDYVLDHGGTHLEVYCDSELIVRQMQGSYRVKSADLLPLHQRARDLVGRLKRFSIRHIPREQNAEADQLANDAMDQARRQRPGAERVSAPRQPKQPAEPGAPPQTLIAVCENGLLRPLSSRPILEEGAEYEVLVRRRR